MSDEKVEIKKEFLRKMHEDLLDIIKRRHNNVLAKGILLASLFGIGGVPQLPGVKFSINAYWAVPVVALVFDLIYLDLVYALRRITVFFITKNDAEVGELERHWEWWIHGASYSEDTSLGPPDGKGVPWRAGYLAQFRSFAAFKYHSLHCSNRIGFHVPLVRNKALSPSSSQVLLFV